jgi:hypothetical protein
MTTDFPSSDEMIRRAKASMLLDKEDVVAMVDQDLSERGIAIAGAGGSMATVMPETMREDGAAHMPSGRMRVRDEIAATRSRRVPSSDVDSLVVEHRAESVPSVTVPPSQVNTGNITGDGRWMRLIGNILLGFAAAMWLILIIGLIDNPDDLGATVGGGVITTFIPVLFGIVLRRAGRNRGVAV